MIRVALTVAIALSFGSSQVYAQSARFTVTVMSTSVYQAPTTGSPVLGQRPKGAVLDVRHELADWIEVVWPDTAKGIAYVRAATGRIETPTAKLATAGVTRPMTINEYVHGTSTAQVSTSPPGSTSPNPYRDASGAPRPMTIAEFVRATSTATTSAPISRPASSSPNPSAAYVREAIEAVSAASTRRPNATATKPRPNPTTTNLMYVAPAHFVGLGGRIVNLTPSVGGTGRVWSRGGFGGQLEIFRDVQTNTAAAVRVAGLQFAPSALYALPNAVSDYFWLRPYLGAGATIERSTLRSTNATEIVSSSGTSLGLQMFVGGELTFAGAPRFALSGDVGYQKMQTAFAGFGARKIRFALSGHWFVR